MYSESVQIPAKDIVDCHHSGGCTVNGIAVAAVLIDQSRLFSLKSSFICHPPILFDQA